MLYHTNKKKYFNFLPILKGASKDDQILYENIQNTLFIQREVGQKPTYTHIGHHFPN
jgi:hypothetical protein